MSHDELGQLSFHAAVARMGSALGAAPALGVNQTTVVRRIVQMEDSLGGILFERRQSGPQITSLGERIATAEEHWRPEKAT
jgi:DNA-binding transcriptional LysR family regulator